MDQQHNAWPLGVATLQALPPTQLVNHRTERYQGGTWQTPLAAFAAPDQTLLRKLYQMLTGVWNVLAAAQHTSRPVLHAVRAALSQSGWFSVQTALPQLGAATRAAPHPRHLDVILHAVRRGNFAVLAGTLPLVGPGRVTLNTSAPLVSLARDHLRTLRSAIPDLDPASYEDDHHPQPQPLDQLVEKWRYPPYSVGHTVADVRVVVHATGVVATQPSELAAVDTVLTTLITNAVRHAMDGIVYVVLLPHPTGQDVRVVVINRLTPAQHQALQARVGTDWERLFVGPGTTGGSGWGLPSCAAYVADCYGLADAEQCIAGRYIAAQVIDEYFVAWFHWPLA